MIRVLHSIDTTGPGGAETVFTNLIKGFNQDVFKSYAVIRGKGWVYDTLQSHGVEPIFVKSKGGFNIRYLWDLVRVIRKYKIDVIVSHLLGSNLYCSLSGMICRVPVISTFHGFVDSSEAERFMSHKVRIINWGSKKIVFVSDVLRKHFVQKFGFSKSKAITVYNGVDTSIFIPQKNDCIRKKLGISPEQVLIGAVGNIRPAKGYHVFLKAARLIHSKYPECRFVIVGHGDGYLYQSLLDLRKELDLESVFYFTGFRNDPVTVYNNLDIFISSSISEGFSISTIEALSCGLPVIVTRSGGTEEIIEKCRKGIICDHDEHSIAASIDNFLQNDVSRNNTNWDACYQIETTFSLQSMVHNYEQLIQ